MALHFFTIPALTPQPAQVVIAKKPRSVRGSSWNNTRRTRSANRNANQPSNANNQGFRFCLSSMSNALRIQRSPWARPCIPFDWGSSQSINRKAPGVRVGRFAEATKPKALRAVDFFSLPN